MYVARDAGRSVQDYTIFSQGDVAVSSTSTFVTKLTLISHASRRA